jgi:hypothetical protein
MLPSVRVPGDDDHPSSNHCPPCGWEGEPVKHKPEDLPDQLSLSRLSGEKQGLQRLISASSHLFL